VTVGLESKWPRVTDSGIQGLKANERETSAQPTLDPLKNIWFLYTLPSLSTGEGAFLNALHLFG